MSRIVRTRGGLRSAPRILGQVGRLGAIGLCAGLLAACGSLPFFATPTSTPTPPSTFTPTPAPALPPNTVWLAPDGLSDTVTAAGKDGVSVATRLPLNGDQRASDAAASPDGRYLAYLVWDAPDEQHGIASWLLTEPNARLIYQPLSGYRIVSLMVAEDSATLLFVEQEQGQLPDKADWRLQSMPIGGGSPKLLASADSQPNLLPPRPIGLLLDGSALFNANTRYDVPSGKPLQANFVLGADGQLQQASLPQDRVVGDGALSPDGTKLAYTAYPGALPGQPGSGSPVNIARVVTLSTGQTVNFTPPEGMALASVSWMPDSARLLLDLTVAPSSGPKAQAWQIVSLSGPRPSPATSSDPARARLFTYLPYGDKGVAYTLFPASGDQESQLFLLPDITTDSAPQVILLGQLAPGTGPMRVIRAP